MIDKKKFKQLLNESQPNIKELPGDLSRLAAIIEEVTPGKGVITTLRIAENFRSTYIYCHNTEDLYRPFRNRLIIELYSNGAKVPELARAVPLSERQVWKILGKEPVNDRQMDLF